MIALTTGTVTDLILSRHIEKESSFVYNPCKKGGYCPMNVNRIYFDKNKSLELEGVAIMLMLFHHCFRLQEIYKGYDISFFPFSESNIVNIAYASKICVSMFAFVTGYGLYIKYSTKNESAQRWVAKRYLKTFSGYWFVWIVCAISFQIIDKSTTKIFFNDGIDKGIVYCVLNITGLDVLFRTPTQNAVWWYMSAAAVFIISIPIIYWFRENIWLFLAITILLLRSVLGHEGIAIISSGMSPFAFFVPVIMGCVFARYKIFEKIHSMNVITKSYLSQNFGH